MDVSHSRGTSDAEIARRVVGMCEGWPKREVPSAGSIRNHVLRHTADSVRLARAIAEERMRQFGETENTLVEQYLEPLVDAFFAMAMAAREEVALGRIRPRSVSDVMKALDAWARFRPSPESEGATS